jgi:hypothetical protein
MSPCTSIVAGCLVTVAGGPLGVAGTTHAHLRGLRRLRLVAPPLRGARGRPSSAPPLRNRAHSRAAPLLFHIRRALRPRVCPVSPLPSVPVAGRSARRYPPLPPRARRPRVAPAAGEGTRAPPRRGLARPARRRFRNVSGELCGRGRLWLGRGRGCGGERDIGGCTAASEASRKVEVSAARFRQGFHSSESAAERR